MRLYEGRRFPACRAWSGPEVARIPDAAVKLRWTDRPYRWHVNDGPEAFVVLDGIVDMHVRGPGEAERVITLRAGDMLHIGAGEAHVAHPRGVVRILVVERAESA